MQTFLWDVTIFIPVFCRTHFFVGLQIGMDAPDVWAPKRPRWTRLWYERTGFLLLLGVTGRRLRSKWVFFSKVIGACPISSHWCRKGEGGKVKFEAASSFSTVKTRIMQSKIAFLHFPRWQWIGLGFDNELGRHLGFDNEISCLPFCLQEKEERRSDRLTQWQPFIKLLTRKSQLKNRSMLFFDLCTSCYC